MSETITVIITTIVTSFATSSPSVTIDNTAALAFFIPFLVISVAITLFCAYAYALHQRRRQHSSNGMARWQQQQRFAPEKQLVPIETTDALSQHFTPAEAQT